MGLLSALTNAIYREYDRRIRRASNITEYGLHHHSHDADHDGETHAEDEAEIVNVPRGTPVVAGEHAPGGPAKISDRS